MTSVKVGSVVLVNEGHHRAKPRSAIVLAVRSSDTRPDLVVAVVCILPTGQHDPDNQPQIALDPKRRSGRSLGLDRPSWLYTNNIMALPEDRIVAVLSGRFCHHGLMKEILSTFSEALKTIGEGTG